MTRKSTARQGGRVVSVEALSARITDLARFYQLRSRDRVCRHGLTVGQCYALEAVVAAGELSITELGWQIGVDKSNASRVAETLVELGLCRFRAVPGNARIKRIVPTPAGSARAGRIHTEIRQEHRRALEGMPLADLAACERVLAVLAETRANSRAADSTMRTRDARRAMQRARRRA